MLRELHIRNFSIIDDVTVTFKKGLTVLTGETGAGKSIVIDALSLALGERATGEIIRKGAKEAVIEVLFDLRHEALHASTRDRLHELGIDIEGGLIFKRIISAEGKNRSYINGSMAHVQDLSEISRALVDIHGQYEHQSLLQTSSQLDLLDTYAGLAKERSKTSVLYEGIRTLSREKETLLSQERERARQLDLLAFQIQEIESADLQPDEEERLAEEEAILSSAGRLAELANQAYDVLSRSDPSCLTNVALILKNLREIAEIDRHAEEAMKSLETALPLLEETGYFLRDYRDTIEFDPKRLEQVQERIELIRSLKKKYGNSSKEILEYRDKIIIEHGQLQGSEERLNALLGELETQRAGFTEAARKLSEKRKAAAKKIEAEVVSRLKELAMPHTRFSVRLSSEKGDDTADGLKAGPSGIDAVEFLISPNPGEDVKPLKKIASGGELSRIMLTLKEILAGGDRIPVLVFDEIDAGIGGRTAETVGRKLQTIARHHQIICITHLPQIASSADHHLKIEKKVIRNRTVVEIQRVEKKERAMEVARMLSGDISEVSLKHAEEMLKKVSSHVSLN